MGSSLIRAMLLAHEITNMARWRWERLSKVIHLTKMLNFIPLSVWCSCVKKVFPSISIMISKYEKSEWIYMVFKGLKSGNMKSSWHFCSLRSNYHKNSWNLKTGAILLLFKVEMLASGKDADPKNRLKIAKTEHNEILSSM